MAIFVSETKDRDFEGVTERERVLDAEAERVGVFVADSDSVGDRVEVSMSETVGVRCDKVILFDSVGMRDKVKDSVSTSVCDVL